MRPTSPPPKDACSDGIASVGVAAAPTFTAGPPVRGLDRYDFAIANGRLVLLSTYSVSKVEGSGSQAKIHKYKEVGPGEHVDGVEQILYPLNPPHH